MINVRSIFFLNDLLLIKVPIRNEIRSANKEIHKCTRDELVQIINSRKFYLEVNWYDCL